MSEPPRRRRPRGAGSDDIAQDRLLLRVFTLADHAATPPDNKLYINGAGVDQMLLQQVPGALGPLWLAARIRVPWHRTSEQLTLQLRALDGDRNPIGPDPIAQGKLEVGRAPGVRAGDEIGVPLAIPLQGLPVLTEGTIYFHLSVADELLGIIPLKIRRAQGAQGPPV